MEGQWRAAKASNINGDMKYGGGVSAEMKAMSGNQCGVSKISSAYVAGGVKSAWRINR